ncbi:MAG: prepilin peptidase [Promethearchaeota archaeon]
MIYIINFLSIFIFLLVCIYYDFKTRQISNRVFRIYFYYSSFLIILEAIFLYDIILFYIFTKVIVFLFLLIIMFILFSKNLIGGADGKTIILYFHSLPFIYLAFFLKYTFLCYSFILIIYTVIFYFKKFKKTKTNGRSLKFSNSLENLSQSQCRTRKSSKQVEKRMIVPLIVPFFFTYVFMLIMLIFLTEAINLYTFF